MKPTLRRSVAPSPLTASVVGFPLDTLELLQRLPPFLGSAKITDHYRNPETVIEGGCEGKLGLSPSCTRKEASDGMTST